MCFVVVLLTPRTMRLLSGRPNRSVNTDAPRAALRARSGSPVTLVR